MKSSVCPICKRPRKPAKDNPSFPFCGSRCKLADLGNWLDQGYAIAGEPVNPDDDDGSSNGPSSLH